MAITTIAPDRSAETRTALSILAALSLCHLLNDTIQSLLPAIYPVLQANYAADLHPDRLPAFRLPGHRVAAAAGGRPLYRPAADVRLSTVGMGVSLVGLLILAFADHYWVLLVAAWRSASARRSSTRTARGWRAWRRAAATASRSRFFQVGGNTGSALGPLLAAFIVLPFGQHAIAWFSALALLGMIVLWNVGSWARARHRAGPRDGRRRSAPSRSSRGAA